MQFGNKAYGDLFLFELREGADLSCICAIILIIRNNKIVSANRTYQPKYNEIKYFN